MPTAEAQKKYYRTVVRVPYGETRRFKTIAKALGCVIERQSSMDRAMDDIREGRVHSVSNLEELMSLV